MEELHIEELLSPNKSARQGSPICMLVYHYTGASSIGGTLAWFQDPASKVSAHYVIGREKLRNSAQTRIVRCAGHADKAWHAGKSEWRISDHLYQKTKTLPGVTWTLPRVGNWQRLITGVNRCSVGIELVGKGKSFTEEQMRTTAKLTARLIEGNALLERKNCVGHEHVSPGRKIDPGPNFDWDLLWSLVEDSQKAKVWKATAATEITLPERVAIRTEHRMESGKDRRLDALWVWWKIMRGVFWG